MLTPAEILGPQGRIATRLPSYEQRPEQLQMADAVADAIQRRHHLIVEAGTGVGKSFAYLVPAILAVADTDGGKSGPGPAIISTHTISLQEQLIRKDIPFLNSVIPLKFSAVLVKGRGNYLCLRRLRTARERARSLLDDDEVDELKQIQAWANQTTDGSLADLEHRPSHRVWDEVASEQGNCMGRQCPNYADCFYYRARRRIYNAQILVVNHALFFSDLALRRQGASFLPDYSIVVFDEAHNLEAVASEHLGLSASSGQVEYNLNRLYNDRTNRGLLVHHALGKAQQLVLECHHRADKFFADVDHWLASQSGASGRVRQNNIVPNALGEGLQSLSAEIRRQAEKLKDKDKEKRQDLTAAALRLLALANQIETWRRQDLAESVY